jgi:hypothetical protein
MYCMVHTMVCIMYTFNVLSRYSINPGDRHIYFLKHLLRYVKQSKKDRLKFKSHPGPWDIETMTPLMQLHFQCDVDLGGKVDNDRSQTSYLGNLPGNLICWCSTDQGSISTSTASRPPLYDRVHLVIGHPGQYAMSWHRKDSLNAGYSTTDDHLSRPVCATCAYGTMQQTRTNHRRTHRLITSIPGQQLVMDAYSHPHESRSKANHCDLITCLDSGLMILSSLMTSRLQSFAIKATRPYSTHITVSADSFVLIPRITTCPKSSRNFLLILVTSAKLLPHETSMLTVALNEQLVLLKK